MDTTLLLQIAQIVASVLLIVVVLMQNKGGGLGGIFGGGDGNAYSSKRGIDKTLHYATIVLAALFLIIAVLNFLL